MRDEIACVTKALNPTMRECVCALGDALDRANELAEIIANKLFGDAESEKCEKAVPPQNVQNGIDRSDSSLMRLISRLEEINLRL